MRSARGNFAMTIRAIKIAGFPGRCLIRSSGFHRGNRHCPVGIAGLPLGVLAVAHRGKANCPQRHSTSATRWKVIPPGLLTARLARAGNVRARRRRGLDVNSREGWFGQWLKASDSLVAISQPALLPKRGLASRCVGTGWFGQAAVSGRCSCRKRPALRQTMRKVIVEGARPAACRAAASHPAVAASS